MKTSELLRIMENERQCILRARERNCNQNHCINCDLVMPDDVLLNAYENVIALIKMSDDDLK